MTARPIKALSAQQIDDLRNGRGMGQSMPAELNGNPGPKHVLELADQFGLTPEQRAKAAALFEQMRAEAVPLAERPISAEAALEALFATVVRRLIPRHQLLPPSAGRRPHSGWRS